MRWIRECPVTLELIRTRVHPENLTLYEKMVAQARNGSDDFEWQWRLLMPDQSVKHMHAVARAMQDQNGELEYIAAVQDVTRRARSQGDESGNFDGFDRARGQSTFVGHHH